MSGRWGRRGLPAAAAAAIVGLAVARLLWAQSALSPTTDQPIHVFTGLEWLERGSYEFEPLHPPLSRVLMAAVPYAAAGLRLPPEARGFECPDFAQSLRNLRPNLKRFACLSRLPLDVRAFFARRQDYDRIFRLAGIGTLPLFVLAAAVVALWAARLHGATAGLLALLLFTTMPAVLGHAGVATTDMALVGTLPTALLLFDRVLERPSRGRAASFGAACGLALLSKYTALVFLPVSLGVVWWFRRRLGPSPSPRGPRAVAIALLAAALVTWAGFRFSTGSIGELVPGASERARALGSATSALVEAPLVPAPELLQGLYDAAVKARAGHAHYVLGRALEREGAWYFFPVALLFKTPLAALAAFASGVLLALRPGAPREARLAPALVAALLLAALPSDVNVGVRHVLVVYPFLCVAAAYGLVMLSGSWRGRFAASVLVLAQLGSSASADPDHLAYFNSLAGTRPEDVLLDSDLDWGQDMKRLGRTLGERGIRAVTVCCAGDVPLAPYAPGVREERSCPDAPVEGWLAVSVSQSRFFQADRLRWLDPLAPVERVGKSIRLYYVPGPAPRP
jgi:hypothetical protein